MREGLCLFRLKYISFVSGVKLGRLTIENSFLIGCHYSHFGMPMHLKILERLGWGTCWSHWAPLELDHYQRERDRDSESSLSQKGRPTVRSSISLNPFDAHMYRQEQQDAFCVLRFTQ